MTAEKNSEASDYGKKRNWWIVLYQDSAPENWQDILEETGKQVAISPLHDKDVDAEGNPREPHWHVIISYKGPTTYATVRKLADQLNAPIVKPIERLAGACLYLTHNGTQDPTKHVYTDRQSEIILLNGFNPDLIEDPAEEQKKVLMKLSNYLRKECICNWNDLEAYAKSKYGYVGQTVLKKDGHYLTRIIDSNRHSKRTRALHKSDYEEQLDQMEQRFQALENQCAMLTAVFKDTLGIDPENPID